MQARTNLDLLSFFIRFEKQVLGLIFLLLLLGSNAISQTTRRSRDQARCENDNCENELLPSKATMQWRYNLFTEMISNPNLKPVNKIPGVKMGATKGYLRLSSCIIDSNSTECEQNRQKVKAFNKDTTVNNSDQKLNAARKAGAATAIKFYEEIQPRMQKAIKNLSATQKLQFNKLTEMLRMFSKIYFVADAVTQTGFANCLDLANVSNLKIVNTALQSGEKKFTVHRIEVASSETGYPHTSLLLDCKIQGEVSISNNKEAVRAELAKLKKEMNWDAWNEVFEEFSKDSASMFGENSGWDTLNIIPITLDFTLLEGLPPNAIQFLCRSFAEIGLDINPRNCEANIATPKR